MKRLFLLLLVLCPILSISFAAQAALVSGSNNTEKSKDKGGPGDGFSGIIIGTGDDGKTKK